MAANPFLEGLPIPRRPPGILYKYVIAERVDVLKGLHIRFSPLLGTNDDFEVRRAFKQFTGPRMKSAFIHEIRSRGINKLLADRLRKRGLKQKEIDLVLAKLRRKTGENTSSKGVEVAVIKMLEQSIIPVLNDDQVIEEVLKETGASTVALPLTDDPHNSSMWDRYAARSQGFVIAFDTADPFFWKSSSGRNRRLQEIRYFDGPLEEVLEDPIAAFISKTTNWSYEREWRLYANTDEADRIIKAGDDEIHLFSFSPKAILKIYVGHRSSPETVERIKLSLSEIGSDSPVVRLKPDMMKGVYTEEPV
jgi:hypothetical protein